MRKLLVTGAIALIAGLTQWLSPEYIISQLGPWALAAVTAIIFAECGLLIGFFLWLAENISTFFSIWRYPYQLGAWSAVHVSKWSSWSLLVIMTFTIVANLKHLKQSVHVPH